MTSTIKVDNISNSSGTSALSIDSSGNVTLANKAGQVLEQLSMLCDGGSYTVSSGTYTAPNVTAAVTPSTSWADMASSKITYTPPAGATMVIYEHIFQTAQVDSRGLGHFRFKIDGTEVTKARTHLDSTPLAHFVNFRHFIPIGGTADTATGRQATWTTGKALEMETRIYTSSYRWKYHTSDHWDGSGTDAFRIPMLQITAIG